MSIPHACPVCKGNGKVSNTLSNSSSTASFPFQTIDCNACKGTGIIWEHSEPLRVGPPWPTYPWFPTPLPTDPNTPVIPLQPEYIPNNPIEYIPSDPVVPLTLDFDKIPDDIKKNSKHKLIEIFRKWIEELQDKDTEESDFQD